MNKMSKLEKKIATILLTIFGVALAITLTVVFVCNPSTEQAASLNAEIESLAPKVEEAEMAPTLIVSYKAKIDELIGGSAENSNLLNNRIDVPNILSIVEKAAASSGVEFEEISMNGNASFIKGGLIENEDGTVENIVNAENFYLLEMKLKTVSDYSQLWDFLKSCEDSGFYVTVDHISISNDKTVGGKLAGEVQVNFYSIVKNEKITAAG